MATGVGKCDKFWMRTSRFDRLFEYEYDAREDYPKSLLCVGGWHEATFVYRRDVVGIHLALDRLQRQ